MKRVFLLAMILGMGLSLGGCTRCGPFWYDWIAPKTPKSCHSEPGPR